MKLEAVNTTRPADYERLYFAVPGARRGHY